MIEDITLSEALKSNVMAIDVFLADAVSSGQLQGKFVAKSSDILLHGHCHQKASFGTSGMKSIYQTAATNCHEPDSGCYGMAGSLGYESEHYDVSKKISELVLIPAINKTDKNTMVVANGFSCRHQIHDFAGWKAVHWVESVEYVG